MSRSALPALSSRRIASEVGSSLIFCGSGGIGFRGLRRVIRFLFTKLFRKTPEL